MRCRRKEQAKEGRPCHLSELQLVSSAILRQSSKAAGQVSTLLVPVILWSRKWSGLAEQLSEQQQELAVNA